MKLNKYTLDRFEGDFAVFLQYPSETESKIIATSELNDSIQEGDIVSISNWDNTYKVEVLEEETTNQKDKIRRLLEELKNKGK